MSLSVLGWQDATQWGWGSLLTWSCIAGGLALLVVPPETGAAGNVLIANST